MTFCVHCGAEGAAKFCASCGQQQTEPADNVQPVIEATVHWTESLQYEAMLAHPEVRQRITAASDGVTEGLTGDDLLAVFDAVNPIGISLEKLTHAVVPIYDKLGIKTGHESRCIFDAPSGRVLVATLCTLASKALVITEVRQESEQCVLSADIPMGLVTNRGKIHAMIEDHPQYVQLSLAVSIAGQWYDWGKSKRMIDAMFAAIYADVTDQQSGQAPRYRRVA